MSQATAEVLVAAGCLSIHSNNRLVGSAGLPIASQPLPGRPLVGCEAPERSNKADEQRTLCNNGPWQIASQHFIACHVDADDLRLELDSEAAAWGGSRELDRQADATPHLCLQPARHAERVAVPRGQAATQSGSVWKIRLTCLSTAAGTGNPLCNILQRDVDLSGPTR